MNKLNKLRLLAGICIDPVLEKSQHVNIKQVTEARQVPIDKKGLASKSKKNMEARISNVKFALEYLQKTYNALDNIPATDYLGDIPNIMNQIEDILGDEDQGGLKSIVTHFEKEYSVWKRQHDDKTERSRLKKEADAAEEEECSSAMAEEMVTKSSEEGARAEGNIDADSVAVKESSDETKDKVVNETDVKLDIVNLDDDPDDKDEGPTQLKSLDEPSDQDQTINITDAKVKIPNGIKNCLKSEISQYKKEAEKLNVNNKDAATFYNNLANAFQDILNHLEGGTAYDIKQAQLYAQTLMGPILHKIPSKVWNFLTTGGEQRSLKTIMKDVSKEYPKIGPQDKLK